VLPPEPTQSQLTDALKVAVARLRQEDPELHQTTERVVVARLMIYLDEALGRLPNPRGFCLDMEYERAGVDPKAFAGRGPDGPFRRKIVPDLIYHQRLAQDEYANHLCIEVKAQPSRMEEHDLAKLALLTGRTRYAFALSKPNTLRLPGPSDPPEPPADRYIVLRPPGTSPYTFGVLLRLYQDMEFIEWI
jgi:hypothetical protein